MTLSPLLYEELEGFSRLEKGYEFEMYIQELLEERGIEYSGNPREWSEWLKHTATGFDIRIRLPNGKWITIECKFLSKRVYPSWFSRDWDSRTADVFVTSDKFLIPFSIRYKYPRPIMTVTEFLVWLGKKLRRSRRVTSIVYLNIPSTHLNVPSSVCLSVSGGVSGARCVAATHRELAVMSDIREKTEDSINQVRPKSVDREGGTSVSVSVSSSISSASPSPMEDLACGRAIVASSAGISDIRQASDIREERGKCRG